MTFRILTLFLMVEMISYAGDSSIRGKMESHYKTIRKGEVVQSLPNLQLSRAGVQGPGSGFAESKEFDEPGEVDSPDSDFEDVVAQNSSGWNARDTSQDQRRVPEPKSEISRESSNKTVITETPGPTLIVF